MDEFKSEILETAYKNSQLCEILQEAKSKQNICLYEQIMSQEMIESKEELINIVYQYAKDNIIHMKVFFKRPYYTEILRDLEIPFETYIGTLGGLASLCLGLSCISIVEIVYHFFCSIARIFKYL